MIPALPPDVHVTTLENGLVVIVREDHSAPAVSAQAWVMAGSIHEGRWLGAGLSHLLEHMLFKGTTTRPGSRIDLEVQEAGGHMNAYTSFDRTVYHIDLPDTGAATAISILCDVIQNATLPAEELTKEKQVILREMDMNTDDPGRRSGRRLFETAYIRSPYRYTVIGYPDIFNQVTHADLLAYYRENYTANNVFFVIVGDVRHEEVLKQIRQAYASVKARPFSAVVLPDEPRQTAPREIIEEAPIELGHLHYAWHIPDLRHPDVPALDVLSLLLGSGRSSRLFREVREKKGLVNSADAWTYIQAREGLLGVSAVVDPDKYRPACEAMLQEIEEFKDRPVATAELSKAIKQFVSAMFATRKTMAGQAQDLGGNWLTANDLNFSERFLAAIKRVTPADVQRVAREYLAPENRAHYALLPVGAMPKPTSTVQLSRQDNIQKFTLSNGLRLLLKEDGRLPFVEFRAVFRGGVLAETPEDNGITALLARMLLKGTQRRNAEDIGLQIESIGGSIDSYGGNNSFGVNAEVMEEDFEAGLDMVADVVMNPAFPGAELDRERQMQIAGIHSQRDQLLKSAANAMRRGLFGDTTYGLDVLGTERSVQKLNAGELRTFHGKFTVPDNCVLAIYGNVKTAKILESVERTFAGWKPGAAGSSSPFAPQASPSAHTSLRHVTETRDKKQAVLVIGFPGTTLADEDRYALELLQEACSDLGSRLFMRIRENLALAYYVGAQNFPGLAPGYFAFYAGTEPGKVALVEEELLKEAELLRSEGLADEELKRAKAKMIGQRKIARQELGGLATTTALDELYGLGYAHIEREDAEIERVSLDQIKSVARKYLRPDVAVVATIKPD